MFWEAAGFFTVPCKGSPVLVPEVEECFDEEQPPPIIGTPVHIHVYVCVYIYMYLAYTHCMAYIYIRIHVHVHAHTHVCIYV